MLRQVADFAGEFLRAAGWRAYAAGCVMLALGMVDGIGLLLLVPLLAAAGLSTGSASGLPATLDDALESYLPADIRLEAVVLVYLAVVLSYVALKLVAIRLNAALIQRYSAETRAHTHGVLTQMSWREILQHRGADVAHALTSNVDTVTHGALAILQFASSAVLFLVQFAVALYLSPALALGAAAVLAAAAFAGRRLWSQIFGNARSMVASGTRLYHGAEDFVRRHRHVRAFGNEARIRTEFATDVGSHARGMREIQWAMGKTQFLTEASAVLLIAVTFYVGLRVLDVPLAALVVFIVALARLLPRTMALQREAQVIASALPAREAQRRLIASARSAPQRARIHAFKDALSAVAWEDLAFQVEGLGWQIPRLEIRTNELAALVGPSGIGKSVLCDVLTGLLEPDRGRCLVDNEALKAGESLASRTRIGYLAQHSRPWQRTVGEALRWAAAGATDEDCWAALEQAGLGTTLKAREGLQTPLGDSALWLSGGEAHRLALAQVLMRKPQVLILDEPSAALDAAPELRLVETIKSLAATRPMLVVTHRESVAAAAERVWVMKELPDGTRSIAEGRR